MSDHAKIFVYLTVFTGFPMTRFYRLSHLCTFVVKAKVVQHCHPFWGLFRPPYAPPPFSSCLIPPMHVKLLLECKVSKCLQISCHMVNWLFCVSILINHFKYAISVLTARACFHLTNLLSTTCLYLLLVLCQLFEANTYADEVSKRVPTM